MANALHLTDGQGIRIVLVNQGLVFYEKSVQPSGVEGGDPINITTNDNTAYESQAPRTLRMRMQSQSVVTYDSTDKAAYEAAVDQSDSIRIDYPDDTTELYVGWLRSFIPDSAENGSQPQATAIFEYEGEAPA